MTYSWFKLLPYEGSAEDLSLVETDQSFTHQQFSGSLGTMAYLFYQL